MSKGFVVDRSINFLELEETIYDRTSIDRSKYAIEITHKPVGDIFGDTATPTLISNDSEIIDLIHKHPLQICATSTPINERITGFNPTPITGSDPTLEETVHEKVAKEDDGVDKVGDDVPEGEARFVPLISSDSDINDGSDLMVGKHFDSKEELNTKLNLIAINGKFEMKVNKSTKSLKEVVCR
ncbi:hypothetical protein TIFTF001_009783 [Ficus carica]|uniref:Uncharacterized protein n=1 Tax=Ficus carica TaxID=3494 RepID=A0AA88AHS0_FICCA|nr:hypothetical protein TIFTF001_009783 [Ficus carica]